MRQTDRQTDIHIDRRFTKVAASQRNNSLRERERERETSVAAMAAVIEPIILSTVTFPDRKINNVVRGVVLSESISWIINNSAVRHGYVSSSGVCNQYQQQNVPRAARHFSVLTRYRAAKRYATADDSSTEAYQLCNVQPPDECFWSGAGDGFVAVSATSGGCAATLGSTSSIGFPISVL